MTRGTLRRRELPQVLRVQPAFRFAYAAGVALQLLASLKVVRFRYRHADEGRRVAAVRRNHEMNARRVFHSVVRLQGLMIKIGQTIGSNPSEIPPEYLLALSRLQDRVPPRPWPQMRPAIEEALGAPIDSVFRKFDRRPAAAASLAQVYHAQLLDGRDVAVKVLYPGIERLVVSDLRVLRFLMWLQGRLKGLPLDAIYQELAANLPYEVDLAHEAEMMTEMAEACKDEPRLVIPHVMWEYSSRRLLVMEWIDGVRVTDRQAMAALGIDVQEVADLITDLWCRQIFAQGFFHADPHPGNLFALAGNRVAVIDFGLTKRLTPAYTRALARLTRSMFTGDVAGMVEVYSELGFAVEREHDHDVWAATSEFYRRITDPATYESGPSAMRRLNEQWLLAVRANPFTAIPGNLTLVSRVFALMTGVGVGMGAVPKVLPAVLKYTTPAVRE